MFSILSLCLFIRHFKDLFISIRTGFVIFSFLIFVGGIGLGMYVFGCRKSLDLIPIFGNKEFETPIILFISLMVGIVSVMTVAYKKRA